MSTRFSDQDTKHEAQDFIPRRHAPTLGQTIFLFLSALVIAVSITVSVASKPALISILFILLASVGWYVVVQAQHTRDLLLTTEFQNALFSSALGLNNKFCIIVKRNGTIVYLDRGFQEMFPEFLRQSRRNLDLWLDFGNAAPKDRDSLLAAIARPTPDRAVFSIESRGRMQKIMVNIDPIQRPFGFVLLRGRDFVEQRHAQPPAAAYMSSPQPDDGKNKPW